MKLTLLIVAASAAFMVVLVLFITLIIRSSDAYREAVARARRSREVVALIGAPVSAGFFLRGGVKGGGRLARIRAPLSGPRGRGTLEIRAVKVGGELRFEVLKFHADGGRVFDLQGVVTSGSSTKLARPGAW